jgi:hypothetical protein
MRSIRRQVAGWMLLLVGSGLAVPARACDSATAHLSHDRHVRLAFAAADAIVEAMIRDDRDATSPGVVGSEARPMRATVLRSWKGPFRVDDSVPAVTVLTSCSIGPIQPPVRMVLFLSAARMSAGQGGQARHIIEYGILRPDVIESDPRFVDTRDLLDRLSAGR